MSASITEICNLPASGFTTTLNDVYDWATEVTEKVRAELQGGPVNVLVWAYREQRSEWLSADFYIDEDHGTYPITFLIGEPHDFDLHEPSVPDMTEALHMVGILCDALDVTITVGRHGNETNTYCTPDAWVPGQTNGQLKLVEIRPKSNQ